MATYTELTDTVAEQWETALKQVQGAQAAVIAPWIRSVSSFVPDVEGVFADSVPTQQEVIEANFRVAERALDAQRNYVVGLFETATAAKSTEGAAKQKSSTKK